MPLLLTIWLEAYHHDMLEWFCREDCYQARHATLRTVHVLERWALGGAEPWEPERPG
jgi:hypothetical protein